MIVFEDWQVRVYNERRDLFDRLQSLSKFLDMHDNCPSFIDQTDWMLLGLQRVCMTSYLKVLDARISRFKLETAPDGPSENVGDVLDEMVRVSRVGRADSGPTE
jgi:hypothetical protein